jgi:ABC-type branched-subunit amino acid transport system substrate-binding protein
MKKRYSIAAMVAITVMVLGMALASNPAQAAEPVVIKVGYTTALSGPAAGWGMTERLLFESFVDVFNRKGFKVGGKTYNFKMVIVDNKNSSEGGAAAAKQLIYGDGCKFIIGLWTWNFPAIAAVTNPAKVILMTRTGNEAVPGGVYDPKKMPYVVFGNPSQEEFTSDLFALVAAFPKYKKLGLLDCTLGKGPGWEYVTAALDKAGIKYHIEWFPVGTQDFTPYITRYAQAGCDIVYVAGWVGEAMQFAKQRWEMGYKDMKVGHSGPFITPRAYISVCGKDAAQGFIAEYFAPWDYKKTKVKGEYIKMCREAMKLASQKQGRPFTYTGGIGWFPSHLLILAQAMEKAGTVDDTDAIMGAIRGGTFSTTTGTWTMSGAKTYGSPIVFGTAGALSTIKGDKEVYLSEYPMKPLP